MLVKIIDHEPVEFGGLKTISYDPDYRDAYKKAIRDGIKFGMAFKEIMCNSHTFDCLLEVYEYEYIRGGIILFCPVGSDAFADMKRDRTAQLFGCELSVDNSLKDGEFKVLNATKNPFDSL